VALLGLIAAAALAYTARQPRPPELPPPAASAPPTSPATDPVLDAFRRHRSGVDVQTSARVERVLRDDEKGSRHERFLIRVADTLTVLVAHNVDLAPRIPLLAGDSVQLRGEYIWDERGGVIHWTHRDPQGKHPGGWIRHEGRSYE
jgi:hypothetical protein